MAGRVFIIGIDGGELSLVNSWIKEGRLPNLARLIKEGSYGKLRSTIPPITGAAWSSFHTGTNPGKHGVFNWFKRVKNGYRARPVNSKQIKEPTIWQILSKLEKKVGLIGVPVTYPPREVNGFVIPGILTPSRSKTRSYPSDLIEEILKIAPDFKFSPKEWTRGYKPGAWVKELINDIANKVKVTSHLMQKKTWDLMMVHFMETDQVQHFMWDSLNKNRDLNPVLEVYQAVDQAIGSLTAQLTEEDSIYIMSDHGFGPLNYNFHIDTWLLKEGYIKLKNNLSTRMKKIAFSLGITKESLYPIGELIYPFLRKAGLLETVLDLAGNPFLERLFISSQNVDWARTAAYSHSEIGHIYLNVQGREPEGMIKPEAVEEMKAEIMTKLKNLTNPFTGKKITSQVMTGEEIYHGDNVKIAPDIVFLPDDMEILGKGAYDFLSHKIVSKARAQSGHHRMDGLIICHGPGIKQGYELTDAHIMDIVPTVLYNLGLPCLKQMDGQTLKQVFRDEFTKGRSETIISKAELGLEINEEDIDLAEDEEMKKRLKGLGYVS